MSGRKSGQVCPKPMAINSCEAESLNAAVAFLEALYPHKTAQWLQRDTGISPETFKNWKDGTSSPTWKHTIRMARAYKLPFLAAVLSDDEEIAVAAMRSEIRKRRADLDRRFAEVEEREAAL